MEILKNLLKIKSLFSLTTMFLLIYGTLTEKLPSEFTITIISLIVGSYFKKGDNE